MSLPAVEVSQTPEDKFREYLASRPRAQRYTEQQRGMVRYIFAEHNHFDAEQLIDDMKRAGFRVSRATVYRTLDDMVMAGLLRKVARSQDREVYEHDYGYPQHDHLICGKCGTLIEFENAPLARILDAVATEHDFRMTGHRLEVYGLCAECSRPPRVRHRKLDMI